MYIVYTYFTQMNPDDTQAVVDTAPVETRSEAANNDIAKELHTLKTSNGRLAKDIVRLTGELESRNADLIDYKTKLEAFVKENEHLIAYKKELDAIRMSKLEEYKAGVPAEVLESIKDLDYDKQVNILKSIPKNITPTPVVTIKQQKFDAKKIWSDVNARYK